MDVEFIDVQTMSANVQGSNEIEFQLDGSSGLTIDLNTPHVMDAEAYEGAYEITPKTYEQTMMTQGKLMTDNVTVLEIPYFETSNDSDGKTVYIANTIA